MGAFGNFGVAARWRTAAVDADVVIGAINIDIAFGPFHALSCLAVLRCSGAGHMEAGIINALAVLTDPAEATRG